MHCATKILLFLAVVKYAAKKLLCLVENTAKAKGFKTCSRQKKQKGSSERTQLKSPLIARMKMVTIYQLLHFVCAIRSVVLRSQKTTEIQIQ